MQDLQVFSNHYLKPSQEFSYNYFNDFISYCDATPKTIQTYTRALRQFSNWMQLNNIAQPTRTDVIAYREELKVNHKPSTVQAYIMAIKQFFNFTEVMGIYPNITLHLKGARIDKGHKKENLTTNQVKLLLNSIDTTTLKGLRDYAILLLMITGGLRTIEIVRANIEDLTISGSKTILYVQGKGREEKTEFIVIPIETEEAIRNYLKARGSKNNNEPLFTSTSNNNNGCRVTTRAISGLVKERLRGIGLDSEKLTAHSLRHTAVTLAIESGLSLEQAQEYARHQSTDTTNIYIHRHNKLQNKGSELVAKAIFK